MWVLFIYRKLTLMGDAWWIGISRGSLSLSLFPVIHKERRVYQKDSGQNKIEILHFIHSIFIGCIKLLKEFNHEKANC
jgi:hypothetical protein